MTVNYLHGGRADRVIESSIWMDGADSVGSITLFLPLMSYGVMTSGLMYKGIYVDVLELLVFVFFSASLTLCFVFLSTDKLRAGVCMAQHEWHGISL